MKRPFSHQISFWSGPPLGVVALNVPKSHAAVEAPGYNVRRIVNLDVLDPGVACERNEKA